MGATSGGRILGMNLEEEIEQVYENAREDVYRYLLTLRLQPAQAQDLTQEVFLRLYRERKKGTVIESSRAWVFRVAHNLALNHRQREGTLIPLGPNLEAALRDQKRDPEKSLLDSERLLRLEHAMETLSSQQKQCLHLRAEGLRYHQIAETLGISISTVSEFLRRALAKLRKSSK